MRCSHQIAFAVLHELVECSVRTGALTDAIHAAQLRLVLPLAPDALEHLRGELDRLRARLD